MTLSAYCAVHRGDSMKDMNWPERVAYLENQLADSDRENQRLSEFIKGLPDGDETPAQLAEAQRFRRSTMYWHERAMKAEARLQKIMARCADLLDEDQFNELDAMTRATSTVNGDSASGVEP